MAYVYRHIRLDTEQIFYIGMGSQDNYSRANTRQSRNRHWHNIVSKAGYRIEIIIDNISWEEAEQKEIEFIALYGRKQFGGILCNLTDGGGGGLGMVASEETRKKQSERKTGKPAHNKGKPMPAHQLALLVKINTGRPSHMKGTKLSPERVKQMSESRQGVSTGRKGEKWSDEQKLNTSLLRMAKNISPDYIPKEVKTYKENHKQRRGVLQFNLNGELVSEHYSLTHAANIVGCAKSSIYYACKNNGSISCGFRWEYKN